jgi:hypothetical protein
MKVPALPGFLEFFSMWEERRNKRRRRRGIRNYDERKVFQGILKTEMQVSSVVCTKFLYIAKRKQDFSKANHSCVSKIIIKIEIFID